MDHAHDSLLAIGSAVILTALLGWFALEDIRQVFRTTGPTEGQETVEMTVSGLTCDGCVKSLTSGLKSVAGVNNVDVILDTGKTQVYGVDLDRSALEHAVRKVGFSI